jgi:hypothetical protein
LTRSGGGGSDYQRLSPYHFYWEPQWIWIVDIQIEIVTVTEIPEEEQEQ